MPPFLGPVLQEHLAEFGRYPPIRGIPALRQAIADWMGRRYPALAGQIDPERHVLPLNGSREGLFSAIFPALARKPSVETARRAHPQSLLPGLCGGSGGLGRSTSLSCRARRDRLPARARRHRRGAARAHHRASISARPRTRKARSHRAPISPRRSRSRAATTSSCSPTNAIRRSMATWRRLARSRRPTPRRGSLANVVAFQSLSKRSGLPGLRSGFVAGDPDFIAAFGRFRNVACPQVPLPYPACLGGGVERRGARGAGQGALPRQFRPGGCHSRVALRLSAARRSLLSLA